MSRVLLSPGPHHIFPVPRAFPPGVTRETVIFHDDFTTGSGPNGEARFTSCDVASPKNAAASAIDATAVAGQRADRLAQAAAACRDTGPCDRFPACSRWK